MMGLAALIGVAIANLEYVDMQSSRNQIVLGLALLVGMCMPHYMSVRGNTPFTGQRSSSLIRLVKDSFTPTKKLSF